MREKRTKESIRAANTARIIQWLKSNDGQASLAETKQKMPNWSRNHCTHIGATLGRHGHQFAMSTLDNVDVDEVVLALFGETDRQRIARENGAKGGKPRGATPSRATIYRDRKKATRTTANTNDG